MGRFAIISLLCLLCSCVEEEHGGSVTGDLDTCSFTVEVERPENMSGVVKSSFTGDELQKISDLNVFVYHQGVLLEECCRYYRDMSSLMLAFPYGLDGFNIYMVGNVGRIVPPAAERMIANVRYVAKSYSDFRERGFPVAEKFIDYRKGDLAHFRLKRLVGQYDVRMRVSAPDAGYVIKDVKLLNCARDVYPFGNGVKASVFECQCYSGKCVCGDSLTQSDLNVLNSGGMVSLYFIENLQGVLLPDNTDRRKKIPSSLDPQLARCCTYMEITADVTTPAARYEDAKYRFYLGQDETSDFSIARNTCYTVTLDFTQNMVSEEEWRIETGEPDVVGVKIDKEEAMVIKGVEDMIYIQAFGNDGELLDFDVRSVSSAGYASVEKRETYYLAQKSLGRALGLRFTSDVDLSGRYSYDTEPSYKTETFRITSRETYNGQPLYTKDIKVRVYDKLFPLLLKLEDWDGYGEYSLVIRGRNPMQLGVSLSASYTYSGTTESIGEIAHTGQQGDDLVVTGIVSTRGVEHTILAKGANMSTLSRIDFVVKGANGKAVSYPRLISPGRIYMGPTADAFFGPGTSMYPGKLPQMADDAQYYMEVKYTSTTSNIVKYSTDDDNATASVTKDGFYTSFAMPYSLTPDTYFEKWEQYYFYAPMKGVHPKEYNQNSTFYKDYSQYEANPFYFVNGGLVADYTKVSFDGKIVRYSNKSSRSIEYGFYGPGRDLFSENRSGSGVNPVHKMGYEITTWKPMIGSRINTHQNSRYYSAQLYMTINGASAWCGNDITKSGYFTEDY